MRAKPKPGEGWSPAFDHAKQPARLPLQSGAGFSEHVQNIDFAHSTRLSTSRLRARLRRGRLITDF